MDLTIFDNITPGNWAVYTIEGGDISSVVTENLDLEISGNIVCEAPEMWEESMKNWKANAQAIAALPQLVAYAKKLEEILQTVNPSALAELKKV